MKHQAEDIPSCEPGEMICGICGVNQSSRGKRFTHPSHVLQHVIKRHPEAANQLQQTDAPPQTDAPLRSAETLRKKQAGRQKRQVELVPAGDTSHVKFCPCCGFHLAVVHAAMEFVNGNPQS